MDGKPYLELLMKVKREPIMTRPQNLYSSGLTTAVPTAAGQRDASGKSAEVAAAARAGVEDTDAPCQSAGAAAKQFPVQGKEKVGLLCTEATPVVEAEVYDGCFSVEKETLEEEEQHDKVQFENPGLAIVGPEEAALGEKDAPCQSAGAAVEQFAQGKEKVGFLCAEATPVVKEEVYAGSFSVEQETREEAAEQDKGQNFLELGGPKEAAVEDKDAPCRQSAGAAVERSPQGKGKVGFLCKVQNSELLGPKDAAVGDVRLAERKADEAEPVPQQCLQVAHAVLPKVAVNEQVVVYLKREVLAEVEDPAVNSKGTQPHQNVDSDLLTGLRQSATMKKEDVSSQAIPLAAGGIKEADRVQHSVSADRTPQEVTVTICAAGKGSRKESQQPGRDECAEEFVAMFVAKKEAEHEQLTLSVPQSAVTATEFVEQHVQVTLSEADDKLPEQENVQLFCLEQDDIPLEQHDVQAAHDHSVFRTQVPAEQQDVQGRPCSRAAKQEKLDCSGIVAAPEVGEMKEDPELQVEEAGRSGSRPEETREKEDNCKPFQEVPTESTAGPVADEQESELCLVAVERILELKAKPEPADQGSCDTRIPVQTSDEYIPMVRSECLTPEVVEQDTIIGVEAPMQCVLSKAETSGAADSSQNAAGEVGPNQESSTTISVESPVRESTLEVVRRVLGTPANTPGNAEVFPGQAGVVTCNSFQTVCNECRKPEGREDTMICDKCDRSFHVGCVNLDKSAATRLDEWLCRSCLADGGTWRWQLKKIYNAAEQSSDGETRGRPQSTKKTKQATARSPRNEQLSLALLRKSGTMQLRATKKINYTPPKVYKSREEKALDNLVAVKVAVSHVAERVLDSQVAERVLDSHVAERILDSPVSEKILNSDVAGRIPDSHVAERILESHVPERILDSHVAETVPSMKRFPSRVEVARFLDLVPGSQNRMKEIINEDRGQELVQDGKNLKPSQGQSKSYRVKGGPTPEAALEGLRAHISDMNHGKLGEGWTAKIVPRKHPNGRMHVYYTSPCGMYFRTKAKVAEFLALARKTEDIPNLVSTKSGELPQLGGEGNHPDGNQAVSMADSEDLRTTGNRGDEEIACYFTPDPVESSQVLAVPEHRRTPSPAQGDEFEKPREISTEQVCEKTVIAGVVTNEGPAHAQHVKELVSIGTEKTDWFGAIGNIAETSAGLEHSSERERPLDISALQICQEIQLSELWTPLHPGNVHGRKTEFCEPVTPVNPIHVKKTADVGTATDWCSAIGEVDVSYMDAGKNLPKIDSFDPTGSQSIFPSVGTDNGVVRETSSCPTNGTEARNQKWCASGVQDISRAAEECDGVGLAVLNARTVASSNAVDSYNTSRYNDGDARLTASLDPEQDFSKQESYNMLMGTKVANPTGQRCSSSIALRLAAHTTGDEEQKKIIQRIQAAKRQALLTEMFRPLKMAKVVDSPQGGQVEMEMFRPLKMAKVVDSPKGGQVEMAKGVAQSPQGAAQNEMAKVVADTSQGGQMEMEGGQMEMVKRVAELLVEMVKRVVESPQGGQKETAKVVAISSEGSQKVSAKVVAGTPTGGQMELPASNSVSASRVASAPVVVAESRTSTSPGNAISTVAGNAISTTVEQEKAVYEVGGEKWKIDPSMRVCFGTYLSFFNRENVLKADSSQQHLPKKGIGKVPAEEGIGKVPSEEPKPDAVPSEAKKRKGRKKVAKVVELQVPPELPKRSREAKEVPKRTIRKSKRIRSADDEEKDTDVVTIRKSPQPELVPTLGKTTGTTESELELDPGLVKGPGRAEVEQELISGKRRKRSTATDQVTKTGGAETEQGRRTEVLRTRGKRRGPGRPRKNTGQELLKPADESPPMHIVVPRTAQKGKRRPKIAPAVQPHALKGLPQRKAQSLLAEPFNHDHIRYYTELEPEDLPSRYQPPAILVKEEPLDFPEFADYEDRRHVREEGRYNHQAAAFQTRTTRGKHREELHEDMDEMDATFMVEEGRSSREQRYKLSRDDEYQNVSRGRDDEYQNVSRGRKERGGDQFWDLHETGVERHRGNRVEGLRSQAAFSQGIGNMEDEDEPSAGEYESGHIMRHKSRETPKEQEIRRADFVGKHTRGQRTTDRVEEEQELRRSPIRKHTKIGRNRMVDEENEVLGTELGGQIPYRLAHGNTPSARGRVRNTPSARGGNSSGSDRTSEHMNRKRDEAKAMDQLRAFVARYGGVLDKGWRTHVIMRKRTGSKQMDTTFVSPAGEVFRSKLEVGRQLGLLAGSDSRSQQSVL